MGVRHFADYRTNETNEEITVEIHDSSFVGSSTKLYGTGSDWAIRTLEQLNPREPLSTPIQKTEVSLSVWVKSSSLIDDIFSSEEGRFTLVYKKGATQIAEVTVLQDLCSYQYLEDTSLWKLTLKGKDFSILEGDSYGLQTDRVTIITALAEILPYGLNIKTRTSWIVDGTTTANDYLRQIYIDEFALRTYARTGDESDEPFSKLQALEAILKANGLILRQDGDWIIEQITALTNPLSVLESVYNSAGVFQSASNVNVSTSATIINQSPYNHNAGVKSARVKYDHRTTITGFQFPSQISTTTSEVLSTFFVSNGTQTLTASALVVAISLENETTATFKVQYKAGQYYWTGSVWSLSVTDVEYDMFGSGIQDSDGNYIYRGVLSEPTTEIPADATSGLQITLNNAVVQGGTPVTAISTTYNDFSLVINNELDVENSTFIDYQLTQSASQSVRVDYGDTLFGDGPVSYSRGAFRTATTDASVTDGDWARRGEGVFTNHAQVLLREVIDVQRKSRARISATVKTALEFSEVVSWDGDYYYILGGEVNLFTGVSTLELLLIDVVTGADTFEVLPKFTADGATGSATTGGSSGGGINQSFADARYLIKSSNLSDLTDVSLARTNLGLGTADNVAFASIDVSGNSDANAFRINGEEVIDSDRNVKSGSIFTIQRLGNQNNIWISLITGSAGAGVNLASLGLVSENQADYFINAFGSAVFDNVQFILKGASGNVGINISIPNEKLEVNGFARTSLGYKVGTNTIVNSSRVATFTQANIDNIRLDGNTISTTNTDGNLLLSPNGSGNTQVTGDFDVSGNSDANAFRINGTEVISSGRNGSFVGGSFSGSVMVGSTTLPIARLQINGGGVTVTSGNHLGFQAESLNFDFSPTFDASRIQSGTGGAVKPLLLQSSGGNVAIGTTSDAGFKLDVNGTFRATQANIDNIRLDGNTISTTDTNGNLLITPNGTGITQISKQLTVQKGEIGDYLLVGGDNTGLGVGRGLKFTSSTTISLGDTHTIQANSVNGEIAFATGGNNERIRINKDGNISVNTGYLTSKTFTLGSVGWRIENDGDAQLKDITTLGVVKDKDYVTGWSIDGGLGYQIDNDGNGELESLLIRGRLKAQEFIVKQTSFLGGEEILSIAVAEADVVTSPNAGTITASTASAVVIGGTIGTDSLVGDLIYTVINGEFALLGTVLTLDGGDQVTLDANSLANVTGGLYFINNEREKISVTDPRGLGGTSLAANDLVQVQVVDINSTTIVKREYRRVSSVSGADVFLIAEPSDASVDVISSGDVVVAYGNTTNATRQNIIYRNVNLETGAKLVNRIQKGINSLAKFRTDEDISETTFVATGDLNGLYGLTTEQYGIGAGQADLLGGNYFYITDTAAKLKIDDFDLTTTKLAIKSTGNGSIALGATPPTGIGTGAGFFVDGLGNFLVGTNTTATSPRIIFNQSSGSLEIKTNSIDISSGNASGNYIGMITPSSFALTSLAFFAGADDASGTNAKFSVDRQGRITYSGLGDLVYSKDGLAGFASNDVAPSISTNEWQTTAGGIDAGTSPNRTDVKLRVRYVHRFGYKTLYIKGFAKATKLGTADELNAYIDCVVVGASGIDDRILITATSHTAFTGEIDVTTLTADTSYTIELECVADVVNITGDSASVTTFLREDVEIYAES